MAITRRRQRGNLLFSTAAVLALLSAAIPHNQSICRADDVVVAESSPDADVAAADVTDLLEEAIDAASVADAVVDDLDDKISEGDSSSVAEETTSEDDLDKVLNTLEEDGILTQEEHVAASADAAAEGNTADQVAGEEQQTQSAPVQSGPFIDLFGDVLLSLEMVDETHAQVHQHYTNEALSGKKVVGLYFSADWCGPCRQFTPDLVNFYDKMNARRGKKDEFEIVWVSRCRSVDDFGQYFTHMKWLALPPQEAMGQRGQYLGEKYKVKSIPTLVLLDEIGNVITTDARNKIPMDKAGIGFPWRSPMSILISTLLPKSLRLLVKSQLDGVFDAIRGTVGKKTGGGGFLSKFREAVAGKVGGQR